MERLKWYRGIPRQIKLLGWGIALIFIFGLIISIVIISSTFINSDLISKKICFSNSCVNYFFKEFSVVRDLMGAVISFCVSIATIGGIFVALMNYVSSQKNFAFNNHIEHLKMFCDYMDLEISKRDRLSKKSFDYLMLYGFIFEKSREGSSEVSERFSGFLHELNNLIDNSNGSFGKDDIGFNYKKHQRKIRDHFGSIGVLLCLSPRVDFFETEKQLFSLINRLSQSFCEPGKLSPIREVKYY